jgi:uncharacterized alkaline shock family protein YloU
MKIAKCKSCEAPIVYLKTRKGATMPVDVDSLAMDEDEIAELDVDTVFEYGVHVSHFATCAHAAIHRK